MHSSRMSTARSLPYGGISVQGVYVWGCLCPRGSLSRGGLCPGRPPPPCGQTDAVQILPCPKLRLRAVKTEKVIRIWLKTRRHHLVLLRESKPKMTANLKEHKSLNLPEIALSVRTTIPPLLTEHGSMLGLSVSWDGNDTEAWYIWLILGPLYGQLLL